MADRDASGKWVKGAASPNPGGRPREVADVRDLAKSYTAEAIETLAKIMRAEDSPPAAKTAAACALLDRAYGRPASAVDARIEVAHSVADTAAQVLMALTQRARERQAEAARLIEVTGEAVD
jgi:hypothetical protein